jgi:selenide,water dikinase
LTQVLSKLNFANKNNQSGFENFDDCAIYKINDSQSIIQTVDFFTPIVDDPYSFGQIAAANSLSDIYAMGGTPLFALNIVAFPTEELPLNILSEILRGGQDKCKEANINILGGHSIKDKTPKFGLAVTGLINNKNIIRNNTSKLNDVIILTKPIGTGIITTASKKGVTEVNDSINTIKLMSTLNSDLSTIASKIQINACTDVTGYGLLGHLNEMCDNTEFAAQINFPDIPLIDNVINLAKNDIIPGGTKNNLKFYESNILFDNSICEYQKLILCDAQTSGGLLISTSYEDSSILIDHLNAQSKYKSKIIGKITLKSEFTNNNHSNIIVTNE